MQRIFTQLSRPLHYSLPNFERASTTVPGSFSCRSRSDKIFSDSVFKWLHLFCSPKSILPFIYIIYLRKLCNIQRVLSLSLSSLLLRNIFWPSSAIELLRVRLLGWMLFLHCFTQVKSVGHQSLPVAALFNFAAVNAYLWWMVLTTFKMEQLPAQGLCWIMSDLYCRRVGNR